MRTVRWVLFLPCAAVSALVVGAFMDFVVRSMMEEKAWVAATTSGLFLAGTFLYVGLKVAPVRGRFTKWSLVIPLLLFSPMSIIGALLVPADHPKAFAGIAALIVAVSAAARSPEQLAELVEKETSSPDSPS